MVCYTREGSPHNVCALLLVITLGVQLIPKIAYWGEPERAPQLLVSIAPACVRVYVRTCHTASDVWERVRRQMSENEYSIV